MDHPTLEERVAALERQLLQLTALLKIDRPVAPNWIERLTGSISYDELFLEALEYGRSLRMQDQPTDDII